MYFLFPYYHLWDLHIDAMVYLQVIVGSFISEDWKESSLGINQPETLYAPGASIAGSPTSRGTFSESSVGLGSPPNHSTGGCNNSTLLGMPNVPWK